MGMGHLSQKREIEGILGLHLFPVAVPLVCFVPFLSPLPQFRTVSTLFSPLLLFISFNEAIILQPEGFRANPILPFYLAVSFSWPCHSCNATLWTKTQRSFLFVRFLLCILSLSLAFLLSVAQAGLFSLLWSIRLIPQASCWNLSLPEKWPWAGSHPSCRCSAQNKLQV